jgi:hypothetical protein
MDACPCGQKLLPNKGVEVQRRDWNKNARENLWTHVLAARNYSPARALKCRDGTGIKETGLE